MDQVIEKSVQIVIETSIFDPNASLAKITEVTPSQSLILTEETKLLRKDQKNDSSKMVIQGEEGKIKMFSSIDKE